jgi:hypothetical protein
MAGLYLVFQAHVAGRGGVAAGKGVGREMETDFNRGSIWRHKEYMTE